MTRKLDALLAAIGILFGATSLTWPFGWDTAIHYYVGREWVLRGAIPYRDAFDHKPPGIHLVHAITIAVFGEGMWGIRVVELAGVAVLGWACASLATRGRDKRGPDGLLGASVLAANVLYYGFFEYRFTAQCELLGTTLVGLALLAAWRIRRPDRAALVAGLATGAAFALKPPLLVMALVPLAVLAIRAAAGSSSWNAGRAAAIARSVSGFAIGALVAPALFVAYFAAHGSAGDLLECVVLVNLGYLRNEPGLTTASEILSHVDAMWRCFCPIASILFTASAVATGDAILRRSRARLARWGTAWALIATGALVVAVQFKFYFYHWSVLLLGVVLLASNVVVDISHVVRASRRSFVPLAAAVVLLAAFSRTGNVFDGWSHVTAATWHSLRGDWSRAQFASTFQTWDGGHRYADVEATGLWIRDHSTKGDELLVRGVAVEIYVVSGLHAPGRFFWTAFLTRPSRRFHPEVWLAEDAAVIDTRKPRWVVTWTDTPDSPESNSYFLPRGYVERTRVGPYSILERAAGSAPAARR
jgi:hypothetical protein